MTDLEWCYCLQCNKIVSKLDSAQIFKTGFYRVRTPLAICKACVQK